MPLGIKDNIIQEVDDDEVDVEFTSPNKFFGSHANLVPIQSAVAAPRIFYGARFMNQALPVKEPEAPLVQNLRDEDEEGRSFDEVYGRSAGAVFSDVDGRVKEVTPDYMVLETPDGEQIRKNLYNNFIFNRKTSLHNTPLVEKGQEIKKGQTLARSNFTDDKGTLAMGRNARTAIVPYKGFTMDDSIAISSDFAKKLSSEHTETHSLERDKTIKTGLNHFVSLFPDKYTKTQRSLMDEDGVVKPGTVLQKGDPMIMATKPKMVSSSTAQLGKLSKVMREARSDASQLWEEDVPGEVLDAVTTPKGIKVITRAVKPAKEGDKIVMRSGQKGIISNIISRDHMPRTTDGKPLEVLLNPLSIPSRVNDSVIYEMLLGKVARSTGKPYKLPGFTKKGEHWYDIVQRALDEHGLSDTEEVFDPIENRKLQNPVTVGDAHILKLHHTAGSKASARGQGSYDLNQQPLKGGSEGGKAKRFSGLEVGSMMSAGAYKTLREGATLRGQKNDEYWRQLRQGKAPRQPGEPFVWKKFQALLQGAGLNPRDTGGGRLRLGPMTEAELEKRKPVEVRNGKLVNMNTFEPEAGGLFDPAIVGSGKWGKIPLDSGMPNPAFEKPILKLLGLTQKEFNAIMAGEMELPERLR